MTVFDVKRIADAILDDTKYPLVSTLEKYERAIENAPDEDARNDIIEKRNYFTNKYHRKPTKKTSVLRKIINVCRAR